MDLSEDRQRDKCISSIKGFVTAIHPTRYSTKTVEGGDLLAPESQLSEAWTIFESLSDQNRSAVQSQVSQIDVIYLYQYSLRMAEIAVRRKDVAFVRFGLVALVVDGDVADPRDVYTGLALLLDASKRINADAAHVFGSVAKLGTPARRRIIERYLDSRVSEESMEHILQGLGFAVVGSGDTFSYRSMP